MYRGNTVMSHLFNYQSLGIFAVGLLVYTLFPLYAPLFKRENTKKIPLKRLVSLVIASILWIMYGISDSSPAIVLLAIGGFAVTSLLLVIKLRSH